MSSGPASSDKRPVNSSRPSSSDDAHAGTERPQQRQQPQRSRRSTGYGSTSSTDEEAHRYRRKESDYDDAANHSDGPDADALGGLRQSAEYRAAWDMELWKAVQAERFRQQLERQRTKAVAGLARAVKQKEAEAAAAIAQRSSALTAKESRLEKELRAVAQRETRLAESERGLRRMRQQLLDAQRRVEDEVRAQVRRANDDITHKALMLQDRVKAAEAQAQRAEERQRQTQADYLELYEEFHRFRTQQLTAAGEAAVSAKSGSSGEGECERLAAQMLRLRAQHEEEKRLLREGLEQRHREELSQVQCRCRDLEEQNRRLTGALARRREQLRGFKSGEAGAGDKKGNNDNKNSSGGGGGGGDAPPQSTSAATFPVPELMRELERLRREREHLVGESAGAITEGDTVIRRLDARIRQLGEVLEDAALVAG